MAQYDSTAGGVLLPHPDNPAREDIGRIRSALTALDAYRVELESAIGDKVGGDDLAAAVAELIGGAPSALDTLNELAAALGDDANYAATITAALAGKQPLGNKLTAIQALTLAADKLLYATGASSFGVTDLTSFARTLLAVADASAARAALGVSANAMIPVGSPQVIGTNVTSVIFSNLPSSGYAEFILYGHNVATDVVAANDNLAVEVSTDNGSTWKTTNGDYYNGTSAGADLGRFGVCGATSTFKKGEFVISFHGLGNASRATSMVADVSSWGVSTTQMTVTDGTQKNVRMAAEADNALRLRPVTGSNITQGTFALYGVLE